MILWNKNIGPRKTNKGDNWTPILIQIHEWMFQKNKVAANLALILHRTQGQFLVRVRLLFYREPFNVEKKNPQEKSHLGY